MDWVLGMKSNGITNPISTSSRFMIHLKSSLVPALRILVNGLVFVKRKNRSSIGTFLWITNLHRMKSIIV